MLNLISWLSIREGFYCKHGDLLNCNFFFLEGLCKFIYSKQYIIKKKKNLYHCVVCASMYCAQQVFMQSLYLFSGSKGRYNDKALKASVEHVLNCMMDICMCTFQILVKLSLFNRLKLSY